MTSILQDWVTELGLRHQGVLMAAIRGCDGARKDDPSKGIVTYLRGAVLNPFCGDARHSKSFIEVEDAFRLFQDECVRQGHKLATMMTEEDIEVEASRNFRKRVLAFLSNCDHLPIHFVMHLAHAAEIIGYYHPNGYKRLRWFSFYSDVCRKLHVNPETREQLDKRLNRDEASFGRAQREG